MHIFEFNKKTKMFWFFLALPTFPREKALRKNKSRERNDSFLLTMEMPKQTRPYKILLSPRAGREDFYFEKTKPKQQVTLLGIMHDQREVDDIPILRNAS